MKHIILKIWWCVCHFVSPDWVTNFHRQHPFWADYLINTLSGLTVIMLGFSAYLAARWFFRLTDVDPKPKNCDRGN